MGGFDEISNRWFLIKTYSNMKIKDEKIIIWLTYLLVQ